MTQPPYRTEMDKGNKGRTDKSYRTDMEFGSSQDLAEAEKHQNGRESDLDTEAPKHPPKSTSAS